MSNSCIIVPLFMTRNVIAPAGAVPEAGFGECGGSPRDYSGGSSR